MPEYRALREKHTLLTLCRTPELALEVTLQPIRRPGRRRGDPLQRHPAAPRARWGFPFDFQAGEGPVIERPCARAPPSTRCGVFEPREELAMVLDAIRLLRREPSTVPLIGFAGAPFTLASYAIEGGHSSNFALTKRLMYEDPAAWHAWPSLLAEVVGDYLVRAGRGRRPGRAALRLLGRRAGRGGLPRVRPARTARASSSACAGTGVPVIHFGTGTGHLLAVQREAGGDVIGVDWRTPLDVGWSRVEGAAVQGNLDPTVLFAPREGAGARGRRAGERWGAPGTSSTWATGSCPDAGRPRARRGRSRARGGGHDSGHEGGHPSRPRNTGIAGPDAGVPRPGAGRAAALPGADRGDDGELPRHRRAVSAHRHHPRPGREPSHQELGDGTPVYVGMRNWHPFIADVVAGGGGRRRPRAGGRSARPAVSRHVTSPSYRDVLREARGGRGRRALVESWHDHPGLSPRSRRKQQGGGRGPHPRPRPVHRPQPAGTA